MNFLRLQVENLHRRLQVFRSQGKQKPSGEGIRFPLRSIRETSASPMNRL